MAATHPPSRSSSGARTAATGPVIARAALMLPIALAAAAAGIAIAEAHPIAPLPLMALFAAWCVLGALRPAIAVGGMFALLPIAGLAPSTGWLTFEEFDLLVLATVAGGYAALALGARPAGSKGGDAPGLSIVSIGLIALYLIAELVSMQRGFEAAGGFRFDWTQGYNDPLNSLRECKAIVFAVLMLPLLTAQLKSAKGMDAIGTGMTVALALGSLAVIHERLAFTGLLDFSDDYRATGSFWEMHVGGATLDGFLCLTIPFAIREALRPDEPIRFVASAAALAMGAYAALATFSRGLYAAIPVVLVVLAVLMLRRSRRTGEAPTWLVLIKGALFVATVAGAGVVVFRAGGYRAVLAAFACLMLAIPAESTIRRARLSTWLAAIVGAVVIGGVGIGVASVLPKGPYLVYASAFMACAAAIVQAERKPVRHSVAWVLAAWLWVAIAACHVAGFWGGRAALNDSAMVMGGLVVFSAIATRSRQPVWPTARRNQMATIGLAVLVLGSVTVLSAGAYMGGRLSEGHGDLQIRKAHWIEGIDRMRTPEQWLFGMGLGRFPATSLYALTATSAPGSYRMATRDGESFLALSGPRLPYLGFGELFRFSQKVAIAPKTHYVLTAEVRAATTAALHVEICEKHLIYSAVCVVGDAGVPARVDGWTRVTLPFDTGVIGESPWYARKEVVFAIAVAVPAAVVEIRRLSLIGPGGVEVLANGDFSNRTARWFSSSDMNHPPFHILNLALGVLFDQGVIGLGLLALLLGATLVRTTFGRAWRHPDAPYLAAGLCGVLVVGAFDNVIDAPRVAFLFYVVAMLGLMIKPPRVAKTPGFTSAARAARQSNETATAMPRPDATLEDERAARALRRQKAFGERRPRDD